MLADRFGYAWLFGLGTALSVVVLAGSLVLLSRRGRAGRA